MPPGSSRNAGQPVHKGHVYPGEHQAIIDEALWGRVQAGLSDRRVERSTVSTGAQPSLLAGVVYDAAGNRLSPSHARKGAKRYRYYVSQGLITGTAASKADGQRLPAGELEAVVVGALLNLIGTPAALLDAIGTESLDGIEQRQLLTAATTLANDWDRLGPGRMQFVVRAVVARVVAEPDCVTVSVAMDRLIDVVLSKSDRPNAAATQRLSPHHVISVPVSLRRAGKEMRLVVAGDAGGSAIDPTLARLCHQALQIREQLLASQNAGISELATRAGLTGSHFTRVLRLGFLAPDILTAIANGRQPVGLTATKLLRDTRLPLPWSDQRKVLGFPAQA